MIGGTSISVDIQLVSAPKGDIRIVFTIMHIMFLPDQDFICCKDVLSTADLCTLIPCVTTSLVNIREVAITV